MNFSEATRVRTLILLDAEAVLRRLLDRRRQMLSAYSQKRDRGALLATIHSRFHGAGFHHLVCLTPKEQAASMRFYERLDSLRYYFNYTEDMPGTAADMIGAYTTELGKDLEGLRAAFPKPRARRRIPARPVSARKKASTTATAAAKARKKSPSKSTKK